MTTSVIIFFLTKAQANWLDWALGGMTDSYSDADEKAYAEDITVESAKRQIEYFDKMQALNFGFTEKSGSYTIPLPVDKDVISDLLYHIEEQGVSMASRSEDHGETPQAAAAHVRVLEGLAAKIKERLKAL